MILKNTKANTAKLNEFLQLILDESEKGNIRLSNASSELNITYDEIKDIYLFLSKYWIENIFDEGDTEEIYIKSLYLKHIDDFLKLGGFVTLYEKGFL